MSLDAPTGSALEDRLGERALALIDVPSVSRGEAAILASIRSSLPPSFEVLDDHDTVLFVAPRCGGPGGRSSCSPGTSTPYRSPGTYRPARARQVWWDGVRPT